MIQLIAFYLFATIVIASAAMVIFARNPVHSVMWLILAFFNAAGLMLLTGAEFIAMLLVIVYVGAVAVLFLFVVMMLDIDFAELRSGFVRYLPLGALILSDRIWAAMGRLASNLERLADTIGQVDDTVRTRLHLDTPLPSDEPVLLEGESAQDQPQEGSAPSSAPSRGSKRKGGAA